MGTNAADEKLLKALNILTCSQARQQLRSLLREEIEPSQGELIREHLSFCEACSDALNDLIDKDDDADTLSSSECLNHLPQLPEFVIVRRDQLPANHGKQDSISGDPDEIFAMIEHCRDPIYAHDGKRFLYANQAGVQLLGVTTAQEIVGRRVLEFIHPDFWEIARQQGKKVKEEGMPSELVEERLMRRDGGVTDVETLALPIKYKGQQVVQVIVKDITERKKVERALRRDATRYQLIVESSTDAIIKLSPTFMILYVSSAGKQLFGYERREVLRRSAVTFIHPDDLGEAEKVHAAVLDNPDIQRACFRIRQKGGDYIWVEATIQGIRDPETNRLGKIVAVVRRAADYKQVEREHFLEFQKAVELYKRIFDEAAFGMAIMDLETGRFLEVNPAYCEMVGYTPDELRTRTFYDITCEADIQRSREVHNALRTGQAVLQKFDKWYKHKSGTPVHRRLTTIGLCHTAGGGSVLLSIVEDATPHKLIFVPSDLDSPKNWVPKGEEEFTPPHKSAEAAISIDFGGFADNQEAFLIALSLAKALTKNNLPTSFQK